MRVITLCCCCGLLCAPGYLSVCSVSLAGGKAEIVAGTYRLTGPGSTATGFIVLGAVSERSNRQERFLVTAAHVLEQMQGETATLVVGKRPPDLQDKLQHTLKIRSGDRPLWVKHPQQDVAVLRLSVNFPQVTGIPLEQLAGPEVWKAQNWEPGDFLWSIGCPHAAQFDPDPRGYPLTRLGCFAAPVEVPTAGNPTFLAEYNTSEGDSGGPVIAADTTQPRQVWVVGLVHGQHLLNEHYRLIYAEATARMRLGFAIVIGTPTILETLELARRER